MRIRFNRDALLLVSIACFGVGIAMIAIGLTKAYCRAYGCT